MKTTKRALLTSVVALILCFSMLVGTTFAWFTDEVESGINKIVAGNLDVEMLHTNDNDTDEQIKSDTVLFDDVKLWEPGALTYEILTVQNVGTLALMYQLNINFENATVVDGHSLDEALKVAVVEAEKLTDRDTALAAATGKWQELESFDLSGELAGVAEDGTVESHTYGIVIYWEPTNDDNLFNMNNEKQGKELTIDLGVHLFATQLEAEKDSFDETYDHDAQYYIQPGQTKNFKNDTLEGMVENRGTVNITGSVMNNDSTALYNYGDATLTDVKMTAGTPGYRGYGYAVNTLEGANTVLNNVTIQSDNGIIGAANGAQVTVNSGEYTLVSANTSGRYVVYAEGQGTVVTINGGEFSIPAKLPNGSNQNMRRAYVYVGAGATVYINGGTFNKYSPNTQKGYGPIMGDGTVIITGGTFGFDPTQWVAAGYEATKVGEVYIVTADSIEVVSSADDMAAAVAAGAKDVMAVGATFSGALTLGSDVNATFVDCTISGNNSWKYVNNATFENCTFDSGSDNPALHFDQLYGNLVMNNCTIKSGKIQIGNAGNATAVFNNCVFGETTTTSIWAEKGMRFYCPTEFNNCEFNNRVVLAGSNGLELTFNACTMNGGTPVYYVDNNDGIIRGGNIPTVIIN